MSIRWLEVEGFKSLKEVSWRPGNLNVVIGPNGSGKSNILDLLELLRSAAAGDLKKTVQQEGGIRTILWDGRVDEIKFTLDWGFSLDHSDKRYFHYELTIVKEYPWSGFVISHEFLETYPSEPEENPVIVFQRDVEDVFFYNSQSQAIEPVEGEMPQEEALLSSGSLPFAPFDVAVVSGIMSKWSVYRGLSTGRDAPIRQATLTRREKIVAPDGENLIAVLHTLYTDNRDFRDELNSAMRAAFGENFEELVFPPASDQRVQMRVNWKHLKRSQPSAMLSDGTLRFLWLMAILSSPSPPPLIVIEEPEVGLHPSMFPIIAEYAAQAAQKTQVIFTTHSADFLDAFRHTGMTPTTTVTQWRDGETHLKVLEGDELAYWLREYTLGQLFRSSELEQIG